MSSEAIPFVTDKHIAFIRKISSDTESFEYLVSQHLRMSGVYWGLTSLTLLGVDISKEPFSETMIEWVLSCFDPESGGFGGNTHHDAHMLYTLSALQILALYDSLHVVDREKVVSFVASLQQQDGSFFGDHWGEDERINLQKAVDYVVSCKNFDGGFGAVPGAESHAGQIFCCIGALSIAGALHHVDVDLLGWWLSERQCDSGGLNGRPEKQADVCYSWWILSALSILGRTSWIDCSLLAQFILQCQDADDGGISDRPGNMADIFHTFFGISGLLLLQYFEGKPEHQNFLPIDPTYALPTNVVKRLGLVSQTLPTV